MFKIGRNDKCWCGCGKKYKACHERSDEENLKEFVEGAYPIPDRHLILTPEQIQGVRESAKVSVAIMDALDDYVKDGISTEDLFQLVYKMTTEAGGICAPYKYGDFPKHCCTSINNVVCHGIPSTKEVLKDGDIINIDVTTILNGYYSDMSRMYMIGSVMMKQKN